MFCSLLFYFFLYDFYNYDHKSLVCSYKLTVKRLRLTSVSFSRSFRKNFPPKAKGLFYEQLFLKLLDINVSNTLNFVH